MGEVQNDNQMYALHSVLSHLSRCDENADSTDIDNVCRQSINLIAKFPTIVAANYNVLRYSKGFDLKIFRPKPEYATAQNFLYLIWVFCPDPLLEKLLKQRGINQSWFIHAVHGHK